MKRKKNKKSGAKAAKIIQENPLSEHEKTPDNTTSPTAASVAAPVSADDDAPPFSGATPGYTAEPPKDAALAAGAKQQGDPFFLPAPEIPTQEGPRGIRYDFNDGARVLLPQGQWHVQIEDDEFLDYCWRLSAGGAESGTDTGFGLSAGAGLSSGYCYLSSGAGLSAGCFGLSSGMALSAGPLSGASPGFMERMLSRGGVLLNDGRRGTANDTIISIGGSQYVSDGGTAIGTTINNIGGATFESAGGVARNTDLTGGTQTISSGGMAIDTHIIQGNQPVSGGTTSNTIIGGNASSQGTQSLRSGGTAKDTSLYSGGVMEVHDDGVIDGSLSFNSGGTLAINTTALSLALRNMTVGGPGASITGTAKTADFSGGNLHFILPKAAAAGDTLLNVGGTATVAGTTVTLHTPDGRSPIKTGDKLVLIGAAHGVNGEPAALTVRTAGGDTYTIQVGVNELQAILAHLSPNRPGLRTPESLCRKQGRESGVRQSGA